MADKNFKVKKNIQVTDLAVAGPVTVDSSGILASSSALPVNLGGTGQTSASAAFDALVPSQTNNANKLLGTDGTSVSWVSPGIAYQTSAPDNPVTGQLWVDSDETGDSLDPYIIRRKTITATAGQTVFTTDVVFTDGYEQIYYNGVLLVRTTDYTTSGSTNTVTLLQGASAGDTVEIISSTPINLVNTITSSGGTITAPNASTTPLTIQGASSQSASLFNIKNSAGETRYEFLPNGSATFRGTAADQSSLRIERYTDDLAILGLRSFGGTISSPTAKTNGTRIGLVVADGYDGTNAINAARIQFWVDGTVSTGNVPGAIAFNTVPVGGGTGHIERMRIDSSGNIGIGANAPANTRLYVYNSDASNPVQSVLHNANAGGSRFLLLGSGGTNAGALTWDNNNGRVSLDTLTTAPLLFRTNNNTAMWIDTSQRVGIGTTSPTATRLHVTGTGNNIVTIENSGTTGMDIASYGLGFSMIGPSGAWKSISFQPTGSGDGIGLAVDTTNKFGNIYGYLNGSAVYPIHFNSAGIVGIGGFTGGLAQYASTETGLEIAAPASPNKSPVIRFHRTGQTEYRMGAFYSNNNFYLVNTNGATELGANTNGMVLTNTNGYALFGYSASNGAFRVQVNSQIFATSSSISTSDGRYKEEVDTISNGLAIVDSLRPVSFKWKDHPVHNFVAGKTVGFIAQEVQEALAEYDWADNIIKSNYNEETEEEFLGIAEANIIPLLVSAVKELKAEFEEYKRLHP